MATESCISNKRYKYVHDVGKGSCEAMDVHHVVVQKSIRKTLFVYLFALLPALAAISVFRLKDGPIHILLWSLFASALLVKLFRKKSVEKESVIIMPGFGVQLETQYRSGKVLHRFISSGKILRPVLSECLTPVTCYWSLSFMVRDEDHLTLVFKELRPPLKMLIPIWRALCSSTETAPGEEVPDSSHLHA